MLRLSRACRCTSTSNSLPCKHATITTITRSRSYSRKTLPNSAPSPHHSSYANGGGRWFEPLQYNRLGFRDWLSSNPISNSSSSSSSSLYNISSSSSSSSSSSNRTDSLLNDYLTNRGPRTKLNHYQDEYGELLQLANDKNLFFLKAMVLEDLEFKELGNKGRKKLDLDRFEKRTTTTMTTRVDGKEGEEEEETMVKVGMAKDTNIIENKSVVIVKEDKDKVKVLEEEGEETFKFSQSVSILHKIANSTPQSSSSSSSLSFTVSQLDQTWENFILLGADLEDSLQDYSLTLSFLHYLLSSSPPTSSDYELSSEEEDPLLRLALKVFSSLVKVLPENLIATYPSLQPSTTTTMKKMKNGNDSIRILLLETLINSALDQDLFILSSKVLLSLLEERLRQSNVNLEEDQESKGFQSVFFDDEKVEKSLRGSLKNLKQERIKSFKPNELKSTRTDLETLSDLISVVMNRESRSRRRRKMKEEEGVIISSDEVEKDLLNRFVQECGERYRWDLIAKLFKERNDNKGQGQGGGGGGEDVYELETYHLKFARWLSGEAPYSTYNHHHQNHYSISNSMINDDVKRGKLQIERQSQPELFSLFARITHSQLRKRDHDHCIEWNLTEKNEWIDLLTISTGSTKETRSLARRIVSFWIQQSPLSSSSPFVLRGSTLLNLIRSSTSSSTRPLTEERLNFLRSLINHSIQSLISPISPYSDNSHEEGGTGKVLSHFDLTSLAQCYDLIGDHESVQQVYKKLLELKFLPDQKDVEIVLAGGGLELVKRAKKVGIKIQEGVVRNLLKGILENQVDDLRRRIGEKEKGKNKKKKKERKLVNQEWKFRIEEVLKFSKEELKFGKEEIERLENLVIGFIPLCQPDQLMKLSDSRLLSILEKKKRGNEISIKVGLGLMKKCFETNHFKLVTRLYELIFKHSTTPLVPEVLTYPLETLLKSYSSSSSSSFNKTQILESLKSIIDQTLSSPPHLSSLLFFNLNDKVNGEKKNKNFELIMKGLIKIGQIEAIENFWQTLYSEQGGSSIDITTNFEVDRSIKELVIRWVVGKEGSREKVLNRGGGIIEEWAKEVLSQRT
ncbi:hypothetical protein JCM3765_004726 [Sporobolomyces pararoseus]